MNNDPFDDVSDEGFVPASTGETFISFVLMLALCFLVAMILFALSV